MLGKKGYEYPPWLTPDHFAHSPEWYESFLGVDWKAIVTLHELLDSDDETLAYQARHVLGLTASSKAVRAILGHSAPTPAAALGFVAGSTGE